MPSTLTRPPRERHAVSAIRLPNGLSGRGHLTTYHPDTGTLIYDGEPCGTGWALAGKLARLLGAKPVALTYRRNCTLTDLAAEYVRGDHGAAQSIDAWERPLFWNKVAALRAIRDAVRGRE